jgi:DNA end-binding protein Ku
MATSVWKGYITFGLISIPVRLLRAARSERVPLREVYHPQEAAIPVKHEAGRVLDSMAAKNPVPIDQTQPRQEFGPAAEPIVEPIRRVSMGQTSNEPAPTASITKGYEFERGRYVTIDPDELRSITPQTSPDMEVVQFARLTEIDPVYFEASYYVKPEEAGLKPYALLYEAMREADFAAIAQFAMHRRERVAVLRPGPTGLIAHTMYFASEVRADQEVRADTSLLNAKELTLAITLVNALAGTFEPAKYRDAYRDRLEALIAAKVDGRQTAVLETTPRAKPAGDMMEALRKSLEAVKKPPANAQTPRQRAARKTGSK